VNSYYTQFLLLPWSWGRDPYLLDWPTCKDSELPPYSLLYCYYDHNYDYYIAEVRVPQQVMVNGLALPRLLKLAFVNNLTTTYSYIDPTVYFTNCAVTATSTVTHIENRTATVTATVPVTVTATVPITITQIANRTVTTTVTVPTTITHVENRTVTTTEIVREIDWNSVIILIIIVAVLVCLACRFGRYGKET